MFHSLNALVSIDNDNYFAGYSYGFQTRHERLEKTKGLEDFDAFIFRHNFDRIGTLDTTCFYSKKLSAGTIRRRSSISGLSEVRSEKIVELNQSDQDVKRSLIKKEFDPYHSVRCQAFDLIDSFKIPRPCAFKSYNLTGVEYYRG
jgi:hypothetical protein